MRDMKNAATNTIFSYWVPLYIIMAAYSLSAIFIYAPPSDLFLAMFSIVKAIQACLYITGAICAHKNYIDISHVFIKALLGLHIGIYPAIVYLYFTNEAVWFQIIPSILCFLLVLALLDFRRKQLNDLFRLLKGGSDE